MQKSYQRRILSFFILVIFVCGNVVPVGVGNAFAQAQAGMPLSAVSTPLGLTPAFTPVLLSGVKVDPEQPFHFEFILDRGDTALHGESLKPEADKLVKYFMAALTLPAKDVWVNLSPYEPERIMPQALSVTDMGRDLLAQDYVLKQLTAALVHPDGEWGKKFWDAVYKKAYTQYGTTDIPVETLNKVWIVPSKAVVVEAPQGASIKEARLKVMLDTDYLAMEKSKEDGREKIEDRKSNDSALVNKSSDSLDAKTLPSSIVHSPSSVSSRTSNLQPLTSISSDIIREIIVPLLEQEVNAGKHFAPLRQIYSAIILASWYKTALKEAVLNRVYSNQGKVLGIDLSDKDAPKKIYAQYLEAFQKGVSAMIRVEYDPITNKNAARKYFSGGITEFAALIDPNNPLLERVPGQGLLSGPVVIVDLENPGTLGSSALYVDTLDRDSLNQLAQTISGSRLSGVKAMVDVRDPDNPNVIFFPNSIHHFEAMNENFGPSVSGPYAKVFGFELQIDKTNQVVGIQMNWQGVRGQMTSFRYLIEATAALKQKILLPLHDNIVRYNKNVQFIVLPSDFSVFGQDAEAIWDFVVREGYVSLLPGFTDVAGIATDHFKKSNANTIKVPLQFADRKEAIHKAINQYVTDLLRNNNSKSSESYFLEMTTDLKMEYFKQNNEAYQRLVREFLEIMPFDPKDMIQRNKLNRVIRRHMALACAFEFEHKRYSAEIIEHFLNVLLAIDFPQDTEVIETLEALVDELADFLPSLMNDFSNAADKAVTLIGVQGENSQGISKDWKEHLQAFFHDVRSSTVQAFSRYQYSVLLCSNPKNSGDPGMPIHADLFKGIELDGSAILGKLAESGDVTLDEEDRYSVSKDFEALSGQFKVFFPGYRENDFLKIEAILHYAQRNLLNGVLTSALARQIAPNFSLGAIYDFSRQEVIFIPELSQADISGEILRFILWRRGPFAVFRIRTAPEDLQGRPLSDGKILLSSIEPLALFELAQGQGGAKVSDLDTKEAVYNAEHAIRQHIFLDRSRQDLRRSPSLTLDIPSQELLVAQGIRVQLHWLTKDRRDIPDLLFYFQEAVKTVYPAVVKEQTRIGKLFSEDVNEKVIPTGGIDFDTQDFLETVQREGQRAIIFSDAFLSQKINGLTPVIVSIQD